MPGVPPLPCPDPGRRGGLTSAATRTALVAVLVTALTWAFSPALQPGAQTPGTPGAAAALAAAPQDPLQVRIERIVPAVLTGNGPVRIRGTVTNTSRDTYRSINLHVLEPTGPLAGDDPIAEATATAADAPIGTRIVTPGTFDTVAELAPGASESFSIKVPRSELNIPDTDGTWWLAVHALGDGPEARDDVAEGRGRMLLPVVARPNRRALESHLVVPLRRAVALDDEGRIADPSAWHRLLSPGGDLYDLLDLQRPGRQVTWLLDPALLEAVETLATGNAVPELTAPEPDPTPTETPTPTDALTSADARAEPLPDELGEQLPEELSEVDRAAAEAARGWLARALAVLDDGEILALPWGDPDVSAAVQQNSPLLAEATNRSARTLERFDLDGTPVRTGRDGRLRPAALTPADDAPVPVALLEDGAVADEAADTRARVGSVPVVLYDDAVTDGRTDPLGTDDDLGVQQRILSEAAARRAAGAEELVVRLPDGWVPHDPDEFVDALDQPWLSWEALDATRAGGTEVAASDVAYSADQAAREIGSLSFVTAQRLLSTSRTLGRVVGDASTLPPAAARRALRSVSQTPGARPAAARVATEATRREVSGLLGSVRIDAPRRVILSSDSGHFQATVINDLPVPVEVELRASTDSDLQLDEHDPVRIAAGGRSTVRFRAESSELGVHRVRLHVTDTRGTSLGARVEIPLRAAQVSDVIWLIMGAGAVLLFGAIIARLLRRWRRARAVLPESDHPEADEPETPTPEDEPRP